MPREARIVPEPTPDEREAVEYVLAEGDDLPPAYRSAWRLDGLPGCEDDVEGRPPQRAVRPLDESAVV